MARIGTALISVSDKTGLPQFAGRLARLGVHIISAGGTARLLQENGIPYEDVAAYTGVPEILDGRIKTLHHKVLAGLLALRDLEEHQRQMAEHGIRPIDMVVVNLYPFGEIITEPGLEPVQAITNIDIGGPTLIRAAAKNYTHVAVVTNPTTYEQVAREMEEGEGSLSEETHFALGLEAFRHTAHYDRVIADYLAGIHGDQQMTPEKLVLELVKRQDLRAGENAQQMAALYVERHLEEPCVSNAEQLYGEPLSFNDVLDANAGIEMIKEFDRPTAVLIRHGSPCGAGSADCLRDAFQKACGASPGLPCGVTLVVNRRLDVCTAERIAGAESPRVQVLAAPQVDDEALSHLIRSVPRAASVRVLRTGALDLCRVDQRARDMRRVVGGMLVQDRDLLCFECLEVSTVTQREPTEEQRAELRFAWSCAKHSRSNAAALAAGQRLVGLGAGQESADEAVTLALQRAADAARGAVLAADDALAATEAVELAARAGVGAIAQSGGLPQDAALIEAADRLGLAMVFTGTRHVRH